MNRILIIIPTYNEADNVAGVISKIIRLNIPDLTILVVDDNSPDGTGDIVADLSKNDSRIKLLQRAGKLGLGTAYVEGFRFALEHGFEYIFEMDADLSHYPGDIPKFLEKAEEYDLVIGSRYLTGVNVINWPFSRLFLSLAANWYTRIVTGLPIRDCTSGYKCFRRKVLENIDLNNISSDGYSFQIEMTYKAWKKKFKLTELPIIFVDRRKGDSKMTHKVMWEAAWIVWKLRFWGLMRRV